MRTNHLRSLLYLFCVIILCQGLSVTSQAQSNIVFNGSFEQLDAGWTGAGLDIYQDQGAADGRIHVAVTAYLWQDLSTVQGRDYVLSFALRYGSPAVSWGGTAVGPFTNFASAGQYWNYGYCYVRAETNVSRLQFDAYGIIDDVKVGWLQEPIRLLTQPESRTGFEGGTVGFSVTADGAPPLRYQWLLNSNPVPDGTNHSLTLTQLRSSQAGQYSVVVSNAWNSIRSDLAELQVAPPPTSPEIVAQPTGDICPQGYGCSVRVFAVGEPPLRYQWRVDGTPLPEATNANLIFEAVQSSNAGSYSVVVSNRLGTVLSLPAMVTVTNTAGGGRVDFDAFTNNAPIYDVDGTTRLGANFLAQVYAGAMPEILRPVGAPFSFPDGMDAGYLPRYLSREIPDVAPGQTAYIQVRAWETARGSSYEEARAGGGKFGFSAIFPTQTGNRVAMQSFSLRAGEPFFITGRLSIGERLPDKTQQFILTGEAGARYLVETRLPPNNWAPFLILTNTTGMTTFT